MATKYEVFIDGKFSRDHAGLMGACAQARTGATEQPGIEHRNGKLTTWMR